MALVNPNTLYSAGNVVVNTQPATQFYLQSLAHKRAKDEAMDNYFRDLSKGLTPSGMSTDDVPEFMDKVGKYKEFVIRNKEALRNPYIDNGKAQSEANFIYNDALEHSAKSVGKVKNLSTIPNLTPEQRERLKTHGWDALGTAALPVSDKNYKPISPLDFDYDPAKYTEKDVSEFISNATKNRPRTEEKTIGLTNPKTLRQTVTTKQIYEPESLQGIGADAASEYSSNKSFNKEINDLFEQSYNQKTGEIEIPQEYNRAFKSVYGKDIHHPQELAAGFMLNKIQKQSIKTEEQDDKFAQAKALENQKQAGREAILKKRIEGGVKTKEQEDGWANEYIESLVSSAKNLKNWNGGKELINDVILSKALARWGNEPNFIEYKDGKIYPTYYQYTTDDNGKVELEKHDNGEAIINGELSKPLSLGQAKLLLLKTAPNTKRSAFEMGFDFGDLEDGEDDTPEFLKPK